MGPVAPEEMNMYALMLVLGAIVVITPALAGLFPLTLLLGCIYVGLILATDKPGGPDDRII